MACGAPVIAANAGAIPEVVGNAGTLVHPDDEDAMASGIARVIDDTDEANRLREAGRMRASEFTWTRTAALTADAYVSAAAAGTMTSPGHAIDISVIVLNYNGLRWLESCLPRHVRHFGRRSGIDCCGQRVD